MSDEKTNYKSVRYLDPGETQDTRLLTLEPLENFIGVIAVDIRLLHQRECDPMIQCTKFTDSCIILGLLTTELGNRKSCHNLRSASWESSKYLVTRKPEDNEVPIFVFLVQCLETWQGISSRLYRGNVTDRYIGA